MPGFVQFIADITKHGNHAAELKSRPKQFGGQLPILLVAGRFQ